MEDRPEEGDTHMLLRWYVAHLMDSPAMKIFVFVCIIANAVTIGLEADYGGDGHPMWEAMETAFILIFTAELALNLFSLQKMYFEDMWNWLDGGIVVISLVDLILAKLQQGGAPSALSVVRLIRILRIIRVISFLEKMVYLVSAFAKGMESVMWVLVLWVIALYIFAVMARGFFGDDEKLRREVGGDVDTDLLFGTIPRCMVTLLGFYTYDATINIQRSIGEVYPVSWAFFMAFIVIVSIGIMELMTSLFIDALLEEKRRVEKVEQKKQGQETA